MNSGGIKFINSLKLAYHLKRKSDTALKDKNLYCFKLTLLWTRFQKFCYTRNNELPKSLLWEQQNVTNFTFQSEIKESQKDGT